LPRPSRNVDQLLLNAGHVLLPQTGVRGLSIRQVAEHAGVNLGMFHYHFKTKDAFISALLDSKYEAMFANLALKAKANHSPLENLRACVNVLAQFGRDNRVLFVRLVADAFAGEAAAVAFLRANVPRHIGVIAGLIVQAQHQGDLRQMPLPQAMAFLMGAVGAPILVGTSLMRAEFIPQPLASAFEDAVLSDAGISARVDMALAGMAGVAPPATKPATRTKQGVTK
jgi:AcrR family transcriptional regulator